MTDPIHNTEQRDPGTLQSQNVTGAIPPSDEPGTSAPPAVDAENAAPAFANGSSATAVHVPRIDTGWMASLQSLATTIVIAVFVITFLVQAFQIPSESMENTLLIGDYLLVDKVHFARGGIWGRILPYSPIQRGDIIVFRYPVHPEQHFVKRVIALPGDRVRLIDKHVVVNGRPQLEPFAIYQANDVDPFRDDFPQPQLPTPSLDAHWWVEMRKFVAGGELTVPPDKYFVLGDNRDFSLDSRYWGFVPRENIIGRPLIIYLSLRSMTDEAGTDDKLSHVGVLGQLLNLPRWRRTFRLVQ